MTLIYDDKIKKIFRVLTESELCRLIIPYGTQPPRKLPQMEVP